MKVTISLDLKRNRIRIHQTTLRLLGNPEYVHFMVNPELKNIAIVPCGESEDALKIPSGTTKEGDIYSKSLTTLLAKLNPNAESLKTYRLYGEAGPDDMILIFNIGSMVPVKSCDQPEGGDADE